MKPLTPKGRALLDHLRKHGSITLAEALTFLRILQLPARVAELREHGYAVVTERCRTVGGHRFARYVFPTGTAVAPVAPLPVGHAAPAGVLAAV